MRRGNGRARTRRTAVVGPAAAARAYKWARLIKRQNAKNFPFFYPARRAKERQRDFFALDYLNCF